MLKTKNKIANIIIVLAVALFLILIAFPINLESNIMARADTAPTFGNEVFRLDFETIDQVTEGDFSKNFAVGYNPSFGTKISPQIIDGAGTDGSRAVKMQNESQYSNMAMMRLYTKGLLGKLEKGNTYSLTFDYRAVSGDVNIMPMFYFYNDKVDDDGNLNGDAQYVNRDIPITSSKVWSTMELHFDYLENADGLGVITNHNLHYEAGKRETLTFNKDVGYIVLRFDSHSGDYASGVFVDNIVFKKVVALKDFEISGKNVAVGSFKNFDITTTPIDADKNNIEWSSENTSIATVDANGVVSGKALGNCNITATINDVTKKYQANIVDRIAATDITILGVNELKEGDSSIFEFSLLPANSNDGVRFNVSDKTKAFIYPDGKVLARSEGSVEVVATNGDISKKATLIIQPKFPKIFATDLTLNGLHGLKVGQVSKLYVDILPSNTTSKKVAFSSSDNNVAQISDSGVMKAIGVGDAIIVVSKDNIIKEWKVSVSEIEESIRPKKDSKGCAGNANYALIFGTFTLFGLFIKKI